MEHEFSDLLKVVKELIAASERKHDSLRQADLEAVRLRHHDLSMRLEGFPQQFATKAEVEESGKVIRRLENDGISREIYDANHKQLEGLVHKLEGEKLDEKEYNTFVDNYRIEQENAAVERRAVAAGLATSQERAKGAQATWKQISLLLTGAVAFITIVILLANHVFH